MGTCFSRNNSLSTMNPKVGVCTRPMDASFQVLENLEHSKPTSLSINLLTLAELTSAVSISLASLIASLTDFSVISLNVTLFCESKSEKIIVEKSTLPVKTAEKIKTVLTSNNTKIKFEVISNPEFLAEGTAIENLYKSDRVLIGGEDTVSGNNAVKMLVDIYKRWIPKRKILRTNVWSSELTKLASNAMLAQRISSINSLSALCEKTGASISERLAG